jgi:dephospho-CoA kinase
MTCALLSLPKKRRPIVIGLTGSIGMGKSTVLSFFRQMGIRVHSADETVHRLMKKGGKAVCPIKAVFPQAFKNGAINRKLLSQSVFHQKEKLRKLEKILHPLVIQEEKKQIALAKSRGETLIVLDIPLLFETKSDRRCDVILCVSAKKSLQKERVMARPGMTEAKFKAILAQQMPDREKRSKSHFVITTNIDFEHTQKQISKLVLSLRRNL